METIFALKKARRFPRGIATIGVFDGVHRGHATVLTETTGWAREVGGTSLVITFDRHPSRVVAGKPPESITSLEHRLHLIEAAGVDVCLVLHFDRELASMDAESFARGVLVETLGVEGLVMGYNCRFGRGGEGDGELAGRLGREMGFAVRAVGPLVVGGAAVSSTRIRGLIEAGDVDGAAELLGRPVSLLGTVVHGDSRGRDLGFPTANLNLHHEVTPPGGVYVCGALVDGEEYAALANIGFRPTFTEKGQEGRKVVEVYLEGYAGGEFYGRTVEVSIVRFLRGEIRFGSAEALVRQMKEDRRALERFMAEGGGGKALDAGRRPD